MKKRTTRKVWYWSCDRDHHHRTKQQAENCLERQSINRQQLEDYAKRAEEIIAARDGGEIYRTIAERYGISVGRVRQICWRRP